MVVIQSVKGFLDAIISPFLELFESFPEFGTIITGLCVLSLGYFGWRAVK